MFLSLKRMLMLSTHLKLGENIITQPQCIVEAFADNFPSIFNCPSSAVSPNYARFTFSDFLNVPPISDSDVKQAIRRLGPSKCVGPDEIPSFIIKGCSEIFASLLSHVFNISLLQRKFSTVWKQAAIMPVFKKGNSALITNYRQILLTELSPS
jgi:hypothetical protein